MTATPAILADTGKLALAWINKYELHKVPNWKDSIQGAQPGPVSLVQRLDRKDEFYQIVRLIKNGRVTVAVLLDATRGIYLSSCRATGNREIAPIPASALEVMARLHASGSRIASRFEADSLRVLPVLVWKPCLESRSPFYPFHVLLAGNQKTYLRVDGQQFPRLHSAGW